MHRSRCWIIFVLAALAVPTVSLLAHDVANVGDTIIVTSETARLKRGFDIVATLERGQKLTIIRIDGEWIGTAIELDGVRIGGWVNACDVDVVRRPRPLNLVKKNRILNTLKPALKPLRLEPGASLNLVPLRRARHEAGPFPAIDIDSLYRLGNRFRNRATRLWASASAKFEAANQRSTEPFDAPNPSTRTALKPM